MKRQKNLKECIRGWFPSTPTLPQTKRLAPKMQSLNQPVLPPPPPSPETKFQRSGGLVIGMGLGLLMIGGMGALFSYLTYGDVARVFGSAGVGADNWVLTQILDQTAIYLTILVAGVYAVVFGAVALRSRLLREVSVNKGPYYRLSGALMGGGGALALCSFRNLFVYLLAAHDPRINFLNLQFFIVLFAIGTTLITIGIVAWTRKK
jgi:hypothetical protein